MTGAILCLEEKGKVYESKVSFSQAAFGEVAAFSLRAFGLKANTAKVTAASAPRNSGRLVISGIGVDCVSTCPEILPDNLTVNWKLMFEVT